METKQEVIEGEVGKKVKPPTSIINSDYYNSLLREVLSNTAVRIKIKPTE